MNQALISLFFCLITGSASAEGLSYSFSLSLGEQLANAHRTLFKVDYWSQNVSVYSSIHRNPLLGPIAKKFQYQLEDDYQSILKNNPIRISGNNFSRSDDLIEALNDLNFLLGRQMWGPLPSLNAILAIRIEGADKFINSIDVLDTYIGLHFANGPIDIPGIHNLVIKESDNSITIFGLQNNYAGIVSDLESMLADDNANSLLRNNLVQKVKTAESTTLINHYFALERIDPKLVPPISFVIEYYSELKTPEKRALLNSFSKNLNQSDAAKLFFLALLKTSKTNELNLVLGALAAHINLPLPILEAIKNFRYRKDSLGRISKEILSRHSLIAPPLYPVIKKAFDHLLDPSLRPGTDSLTTDMIHVSGWLKINPYWPRQVWDIFYEAMANNDLFLLNFFLDVIKQTPLKEVPWTFFAKIVYSENHNPQMAENFKRIFSPYPYLIPSRFKNLIRDKAYESNGEFFRQILPTFDIPKSQCLSIISNINSKI